MDLLIKEYIPYNTDVYLLRYLIDIQIYKENQTISISIPSKKSDDCKNDGGSPKARLLPFGGRAEALRRKGGIVRRNDTIGSRGTNPLLSLEEVIIWKGIKCRIDLELNKAPFSECPICLRETNDEPHFISCNNCSGQWCNPCFIEMTRNNIIEQTELRCPLCRFCFTGEIPTIISKIAH